MRTIRWLWLAGACIGLLAVGVASPAQAASDDPLFFYAPVPPPVGNLAGPCGLTVNPTGQIYVSDYYHRVVDVFGVTSDPSRPLQYIDQTLSAFSGFPNPHTGPVDDPCGLAFDSSGALYLNNYHREVVRFPTPISLDNPGNKVIDTGDFSNIYNNPTGVAVDPVTNHAYVDDRVYVAERTSTGALVQKIGQGTLQDGYGIAVSGYPGTAGYLYVPDAGGNMVNVYDPEADPVNPIGSLAKPGGFGSLVDSSIAVDNSTGEIYVTDTIGPQYSENPQAVVFVFSSAGAYEGRLKHATISAAPVGLAVDNSGTSRQSWVYVTSGITGPSSIYAYAAHAATSASEPPLAFSGGGAEGSSAGATPNAAVAPPPTSAGSLALAPGPSPSAQGDVPRKAEARRRQRRAILRRQSHRRHIRRVKRDQR
jgi:hypothetical protein